MFKELLADLKQSKCVLIGLGEMFSLKNPEDELKYIHFYKTLKEKLGARIENAEITLKEDLKEEPVETAEESKAE